MNSAAPTLAELVEVGVAANTPAENREIVAWELCRRLTIMARHVTGSDLDLADDAAQHVCVQLIRGMYEPRAGRSFEAWVWVVLRRYCWDARQLRLRSTGGGALPAELADNRDDRPASDLSIDFTTRFGPDDEARIRSWTARQRVVLLAWALLWRKADPILWAESLAAVGMPGPFPGPGFEHLSDSERRRTIAAALGVAPNSVTQALGRRNEQLLGLRFLKELDPGEMEA